MIDGNQILDRCAAGGITLMSGVPCSTIAGLFAAALAGTKPRYVAAANEGEAVAVAAGAWLAGGMGAALFQNSGLGNAVNPLTSLLHAFDIPIRLFIGWRGAPRQQDERQHELMGAITADLLRQCGIAPARWADAASDDLTSGRKAYLFKGGELAQGGMLEQPAIPARSRPTLLDIRTGRVSTPRQDFIAALAQALPDPMPIVASTGYAARDLYSTGHSDRHFYQVGSMGCASSIALGITSDSGMPVAVIDGDGAALMRLGALAAIGASAPPGFVHLLIDNGVHESTGRQPTASSTTDLAACASACGYAAVARCDRAEDLATLLGDLRQVQGPLFIHAKASPSKGGASKRPTIPLPDLARRFRGHMKVARA